MAKPQSFRSVIQLALDGDRQALELTPTAVLLGRTERRCRLHENCSASTLLQHCVLGGAPLEAFAYLYKERCLPLKHSRDGLSVLALACAHGRRDIMHYLLAEGESARAHQCSRCLDLYVRLSTGPSHDTPEALVGKTPS